MTSRQHIERGLAMAWLPLAVVVAVGLARPRRVERGAPTGVRVVGPGAEFARIGSVLRELAAAAGGQVYLPAGTYEVDAPIMLPDRTTVRGDGPGTVLVATEAFDRYLREHDVYRGASDVSVLFQPQAQHVGLLNVKDAAGVRIFDLTIRGNREEVRNAPGVQIANARDVTLRGVAVTGCGGSGVAVVGSREVVLTEIVSTENHNGIVICGPGDTTRDITVTNCRIADNRWSGVYLCGAGAGAARARHGPANVTVAHNIIQRHMCDEGIKCHGVRDVIVTGNRIDYALEAGISMHGGSWVVADNIISHADDGMNNKGNGVGITYGSYDSDRLNAVIHGNICRENNSGIWSEGFLRTEDGNRPLGRVAVLGNVCSDNVTAGMGYIMKTDLACIGNVCVDNGHSVPDPSSPAEANMGIIAGGGTARTVCLGNVISDSREGEDRRLMFGLLLRGCDEGVAAYNYVDGGHKAAVAHQAPGPNYLEERNGSRFNSAPAGE